MAEEDMIQFEPDFRFNDLTISQSQGEYQRCVRLMYFEPHPWCLISNLTLIHPFGMAEIRLEFYEDGKVKIVDFNTSNPDPVSNYDLRSLNSWVAANGWQKPEPSIVLVRNRIDFWRHMWEVNMVDSSYLDERYGSRPGTETGDDKT